MRYVLTNEEMREADCHTIEKLGVPSLALMERAGEALAAETEKLCKNGEILCLCGGGNNGGDGFVCARLLKERGREVDVVCAAEKHSADCLENKEKWTQSGGEIYGEIPQKRYAAAIDCLFGTGFRGELLAKEKGWVSTVNGWKKEGTKILSADIPSGVDGKNGRTKLAVLADVTVCIGEIKTGVLLNDGVDCAGGVKRVDIGICLPKNGYARLVDEEFAREILPKRKRNSHKGSYGRAAIVAGSIEYTGAAYLSASACLRSGVGYVVLYLPENILPFYALKAPEILLRACCEGDRYAFNEEKMKELLSYECVAYGMGMGASKEVYQGARWLLQNYEGKLLLDADGLNALAEYGREELKTLLQNKKCEVILTPHVKEFSRISGCSVEEILDCGVSLAEAFAKETQTVLLLKNAVSVITDGRRTAFNATGNSGQAKGGSGDVSSGLIAGLAAQGASTYESGVLGAYLTGKAAELAVVCFGEYSLTPTDTVAYIGKAFLSLTEDADEYRRKK